MTDKSSNFAEKCFARLCYNNIRHWSQTGKDNIPPEELMALQKEEWEDFWKRFDSPIPDFRNKIVVDYGCGFGYDSLFILQNGAKHVYCLEISENRINNTKELHASHGYTNATYIINTNVKELINKIEGREVDLIICRDVMEHVPSPLDVIDSMYSVLPPDGEIYIGFSPIYKSPYGPHIKTKCKIPWIHLVFSETTILNVFKRIYRLPPSITSYIDIEGSGVNKLSYFDYKQLINGFSWNIEVDFINQFPEHRSLTKTLNIFLRLIPSRPIKEFFIVNSYIKITGKNHDSHGK